ncbi:MAG TPA: divalent-cation tolerance protein CutA [Terriglobales bacterium]|nr:divalent-cation tolerance protein CutA [Terriglobales bacterium]
MTYNRIILTTTGNQTEARKIARALVEQKLVACVNIVPGVESVYRWKGKLESSNECLLAIKTSQKRFKAVQDVIKQMHTYDLPEIVSVAIEGGSKEYLKWLVQQVK